MLFKCFERTGLGSVPKRKPLHAMKLRKDCMKLCVVVVYVSIAASLFIHCDARIPRYSKGKHHQGIRQARSLTIKVPNKLKALKHLDLNNPYLDEYNANAPNPMPSFDDTMGSLPPSYLSQNTPPYCVYPPFTPLPPSTTVPTPIVYAQPPPPALVLTPSLPFQNPPPGVIPNPPEYSPTPPEYVPSPPGFEPSPPGFAPSPPGLAPSPPSFEPSPPEYVPGPPQFEPSPPEYVPGPPQFEPSPPEYVPGPPEFEPSPPAYVPGPPEFEPSPPEYIPSPPEYIPSPSVFLPPVVFPPPAVPPHGNSGPGIPLWCVAKPTVPDPIIQEAMNYACGSGADCESILPNGSCYNPDKLISHASYAFNSYWQRTKATGGTCDFGGTAILITKDPSKFKDHIANGLFKWVVYGSDPENLRPNSLMNISVIVDKQILREDSAFQNIMENPHLAIVSFSGFGPYVILIFEDSRVQTGVSSTMRKLNCLLPWSFCIVFWAGLKKFSFRGSM